MIYIHLVSLAQKVCHALILLYLPIKIIYPLKVTLLLLIPNLTKPKLIKHM